MRTSRRGRCVCTVGIRSPSASVVNRSHACWLDWEEALAVTLGMVRQAAPFPAHRTRAPMVHTGRVHSHRSTVRTVQLRVGRHRCAKEPGNKPNSEAEGKYDVRRGVPAASDRASRGFFFVCSGEALASRLLRPGLVVTHVRRTAWNSSHRVQL